MDIILPDFCAKEHLVNASLWVGDEGCTTPLHQDGLDNVVYQIKGSKKWIIIHPYYSDILNTKQPFPDTDPNLFTSTVDLETIMETFEKEKFYNTYQVQEIILNEGEALFLPAGWFHFVITVSDSITLNFWADSKLTKPLFLVQ